MLDQYQFSGSLPENASTYVTRKADGDLYAGLKAGKFCYVLNSRQSGKSSLRVRTMQRLRGEGVQCAAIDLSAGGIQNVPPEQWYADLIDNLIESFDLDVDFGDWWEANKLNSLVTRFRKFLEEILLAEVQENIVIFIDEIDSVLSLKFPTDDFFALIRACYNKRVDNPELLRLTFCLLGVASPSNLIEDKQRTPFNIGQAISLTGFQLHEVEPLAKGIKGKFPYPEVVMKEILSWTGGQPFLTQKLCQFMIEESFADNPRTVKQVVKSRIIENWESQDEPEHLRTIQARILRDEQRAGYLLELYQQIRLRDEQSEITADDTLEQSELQLSGLVVRQQNNLRVYNPIYQEVFNQNWIDNQLKNLRPYSENFRFWVASQGNDASRLLRGKALEEAEAWAKPKSLSYQDRQFLAASKEQEIQEEIAAKEKEAVLKRERKDREATESRNELLSQANKKAQRRISVGIVILVVAVLGAATLGILSRKQVEVANKQVDKAQKNLTQAQQKTKDVQESERKAKDSYAQAISQERKAKENEKLAQQKAIEADKTAKEEKQQAENSKKSASKFKQDAAIARQYLNTANSQLSLAQKKESAILAKLKDKEAELNQTNTKNEETKIEVANVRQLVQLAGELRNKSSSDSDEALRLAALSFNIDNHQLKQALLFAAKSQAYQQLEKWGDAKKEIRESQKNLSTTDKNELNSSYGLQIQVFFLKTQGSVLEQKQEDQEAIKAYTTAFKILKTHTNETDPTKNNPLLTAEDIEAVHRSLLKLLSTNTPAAELRERVEKSLTQHLYAQLEYSLKAKNWQAADRQTHGLMVNIAKDYGNLDYNNINNFSCSDLKTIDQLWVNNSDKRFGFSVQKEIWISTGNRLGIKLDEWNDKDTENYLRFAKAVDWYSFSSYSEINERIKKGLRGVFPYMGKFGVEGWGLLNFFSRVATCKV
ncbi:AAA-like domain-containing protein [Calothrix sp. PCC 7507]|uniref:AAA-like domain-containing protein n=1 Tax=Calothrix sp. PCC 7507 TaxID=99598 RepID=UPI00029ECA3D|nr:AAA-like domain-containing protein [Calothrix sp. PCC 7507]AFY34678.1 GUN4 domain protein [Calothrix sp. PCC 7507]